MATDIPVTAGAALPKLGIIAGAGALPPLLAAACENTGRPYYVLGLSGFADAEALSKVGAWIDGWIQLGEIGKGFALLKEAGVADVVMAGAVRRPSLASLKLDMKGAAFLARVAGRALGDDGLLSAVIAETEQNGFRVVGADSILADLLAPEGVLGKHRPDDDANVDIAYGFDVVRALGTVDVGQAVVVQQGIVLGVEAAEGTDALINRCKDLRLDAPGGVLVKARKPNQERRADLPTIGPLTVHRAVDAGLRGIAVEAGHTLIIARSETIAAADAAGIFLIGIKS